jgi:hypothetical protein
MPVDREASAAEGAADAPIDDKAEDEAAVRAAPASGAVRAEPRDTAIIQPVVIDKLPELETELPAAPPVEVIEQDLPPDVIEAELAAAKVAGVTTRFEPEPAPDAKPTRDEAAEPVPDWVAEPAEEAVDVSIRPPRPDPFPWGDRGSVVFSDSDELEQTLIVPHRDTGERFVLQFSTGESVTVFGSGLLGRNPTPQPTEYFDQLVSITDPGKSVSKTHLEFGQDGGAFWVSDRFSGNGSAVREPESAPRRLVAGKHYRIVRGTRVDIGEQFFVVS